MASKKIKKDEYDVRFSSVPSERLVQSLNFNTSTMRSYGTPQNLRMIFLPTMCSAGTRKKDLYHLYLVP